MWFNAPSGDVQTPSPLPSVFHEQPYPGVEATAGDVGGVGGDAAAVDLPGPVQGPPSEVGETPYLYLKGLEGPQQGVTSNLLSISLVFPTPL